MGYIDGTKAVEGMAIIALAAITGTLGFGQVMAWDSVWSAWLTSADGANLSGVRALFLNNLPAYMLIFYALVILALATPRAVIVRV